MHDFIGNISNVIDSKFIINKAHDSITIKEEQNNHGCKNIVIKLKRKQVFSFNLDQKRTKYFRTFQFFNPSTSGISMINDGIVIIVENSKINFLLFELKSNGININDIQKKIKNAEYFCRYIINIINEHYNKSYNEHNIVFKTLLVTTNTTKTTTSGNRKITFKKIGEIENFASIPCNRDYRIEAFI
jgi:hypothetical protein